MINSSAAIADTHCHLVFSAIDCDQNSVNQQTQQAGIGTLAASPKVVATEEIGLDYYRYLSPSETCLYRPQRLPCLG
jgi:Tat protein secretion system quality control protein TatD with DNase activity